MYEYLDWKYSFSNLSIKNNIYNRLKRELEVNIYINTKKCSCFLCRNFYKIASYKYIFHFQKYGQILFKYNNIYFFLFNYTLNKL